MTTDLFVRKVQRLLARRPASGGINVQMSKDVGLPVAVPAVAPDRAMSKGGMAPPPFAGTAVDVSPGPAPPVVESLGLVMIQNRMSPVKVAVHARSEVPPGFPASLVGGL